MKNERPRLIYAYSRLAQTGLGYIRCERLLSALEQEFEVTRICTFFPDEVVHGGLPKALQYQILPESALLDSKVKVLFIEGRLELPYKLNTRVGSVSINLLFLSFSLNPDDLEQRVAREIVIRMADRRVLNAFECCDNCIDQETITEWVLTRVHRPRTEA